MYAIKIKMKSGCRNSQRLDEIDEIYVEGCTNPGYFKKATLHDYVKEHSDSIRVKIQPYPSLIHATSAKGEKYVKSTPNDNTHDNLLDLPRE